MPRINPADIAHLVINTPDYTHGNGEDDLFEFDMNLGISPKKSKLSKLSKIEKHLKHHPSPDDEMELKEDKNKLRLLKYIDTKWFDDPEYIKIKKVKLLKNRVIKKINSGEFTHKKEVNKYIKAYNAKNF